MRALILASEAITTIKWVVWMSGKVIDHRAKGVMWPAGAFVVGRVNYVFDTAVGPSQVNARPLLGLGGYHNHQVGCVDERQGDRP